MRDDHGRFKKGYSGNKGGRPRGRGLRQEIERSLSKKVVTGSRRTRMEQVADILVSKAQGADLRAIELILRRLWPERLALDVESTPTLVFRDFTGIQHEKQFQREAVEVEEVSTGLPVALLGRCHEIDFLGGMGSSLCDRAMIDLVEGDVDGAWVRYERGLACYEEGGYLDHAAAAREMWEQAAAS